MKFLIPAALAAGSLVGFLTDPWLATGGVTMLALYMALVMTLLGCHLVEAYRS